MKLVWNLQRNLQSIAKFHLVPITLTLYCIPLFCGTKAGSATGTALSNAVWFKLICGCPEVLAHRRHFAMHNSQTTWLIWHVALKFETWPLTLIQSYFTFHNARSVFLFHTMYIAHRKMCMCTYELGLTLQMTMTKKCTGQYRTLGSQAVKEWGTKMVRFPTLNLHLYGL